MINVCDVLITINVDHYTRFPPPLPSRPFMRTRNVIPKFLAVDNICLAPGKNVEREPASQQNVILSLYEVVMIMTTVCTCFAVGKIKNSPWRVTIHRIPSLYPQVTRIHFTRPHDDMALTKRFLSFSFYVIFIFSFGVHLNFLLPAPAASSWTRQQPTDSS